MRHRWRWRLLIGLFTVVLLSGVIRVSAHANLVRSEPAANAVLDAAPTQLRLWFSEAPEPRFSEVQLFDKTGRRATGVGSPQLDSKDNKLLVASLPPLPFGTYTVAWRVVSAVDGHAVAGAFAFVIGRNQIPAGGIRPTLNGMAADSSSGPTIPGVATRWLGYLGLAMLTGGFAFVPLVLQPALRSAGTRPMQKRSPASPPILARYVSASYTPALFTLLTTGWLLALIATLAGAVLQAATSASVEPWAVLGSPLVTLLNATRYGTLFWVRLIILLLIGLLLPSKHKHTTLRIWWMGLGLSNIVLLITSLGSHAAASPTLFFPLPSIGSIWQR